MTMPLPELFIQQINELLPNEASDMLAAIEKEPSLSVRLNSSKLLPELTAKHEMVPWCNEGLYLEERPQFTFDPLLHGGRYYVQDASSMILTTIIRKLIDSPVRYLDLCAAPGGKTTAAISSLPEGSLVLANEIMNNRAQALRENIIKWGDSSCIVTNTDSKAISRLKSYFDVIAADVPCSGEGMMRKDDEAVSQWTLDLVDECAARQREIIDNAWMALRPGGLLIYSTCTFNRKENEMMVEYIVNTLGGSSIDLDFPMEWAIYPAIDSKEYCYRFLPHCVRGEGLFISVIRKDEDENISLRDELFKKKSKPNGASVPSEIKNWIKEPDLMSFSMINDKIQAFPKIYADDLALIQQSLKVIYAGCELASLKGHDYAPSQALAISTIINCSAFSKYDVPYNDAIAYLRGESITIDAPKGITLITYKNLPIGFAKNLGNRANNLYPKEWRIKSTYMPNKQPEIISYSGL